MPPIRPASKSQMLSASVCSSAPPALAVDRRPNQDGPTPLLHPHYQASSLLRAGPSLHCPGSVLCPLQVLPLGVLPLAPDQALTCPSRRQRRSFPRSTLAPEPGSRRLCAGCHLGSKQVPPRLVPSTKASSVSTSLIGLSTRSSTVYLIRLPGSYLTPSHGRLFRNAHHPGRCAGAARGGLEPLPAKRPRGTYPHHQRSITSGCPIYIGSTLHVRGATSVALRTSPRLSPEVRELIARMCRRKRFSSARSWR